MHQRHLRESLLHHINVYKEAIVLTGPRQVGKTTLLKNTFPEAVFFTMDDQNNRQLFNTASVATYQQILPKNGIVILDEIQFLDDPGLVGKLIYDAFPDIKLIITGSAGIAIKNKHTESMAGRVFGYELFPLTLSEYLTQSNIQSETLNYDLWQRLISPGLPIIRPHLFDQASTWERLLIYGQYPSVLNHPSPEKYLENLVERIIWTDLLDLKLISERNQAIKLIKLLAYQIGNLVSYQDLSNRAEMDIRTVKRYLDLFEQSYLIYRLYPYHRRERDSLSKRPKIYFCDVGVRNCLIGNFSSLGGRIDTGELFENWLVMEAVKANRYLDHQAKLGYWRTIQDSEVDLVIQHQDQLFGIEIKWKRGKFSKAFTNRYPEAITKVITSDNCY